MNPIIKNSNAAITSSPDERTSTGQSLRRQAEAIFQSRIAQSPEKLDAQSPKSTQRALHELTVYQIELELQNEELRQSQLALSSSQARYFDLYNLAPVGYCTLSEAGLIIEANLTAATLLGMPRSELVRQPIARFVARDYADSYYLLRKALVVTGMAHACELRMVKKDGTQFWVHIASSAGQSDDGSPVLRIVINDIEKRKEADEALRVSEENFRSIFENANTGMAAADRNGRLIHFNEALRSMLGYSAEALHQMHFSDFTFSDDIAGELLLFDEIVQKKRDKYRIEKRFLACDGRILWGDLSVSTTRDDDGEIVNFIGVITDITERKEFAQALAVSRQKLRTLAAHQEETLEQERKHIALEVHDELGQLLTALKMDISLVRLRFGDNPELLQMAESMRLLVEKTITVVRHVASNLRPAALDLGLTPAIEWLAEDFTKRWSLRCRIDTSDGEIVLDDLQSTAVFRIIQESLTNIARHARAGEVVITLRHDRQLLQVIVSDDGQGFDMAAIGKGTGFGLFGMRERLLSLGGTLRIDSKPGTGTAVNIELPLANSEPA